MISFQKEDVELEALRRLKKFDEQKYKDAYKAEMPDIQNDINEVGVEVVTVDFNEMLFLNKPHGTPFINFLKMTKCLKLQKKDIELLFEFPHHHPSIQNFINMEPVYEKDGKAQFITSMLEIEDLKPKEEIFLTIHSHYQYHLDSEQNISLVIPPAQWVGKLPNMMLEAVKDKENKTAKYKVFKEMNLYIQSFTSDIEEISEFEKLLKEYNRKNKCVFKNIYLPLFWENKGELYHIDLG